MRACLFYLLSVLFHAHAFAQVRGTVVDELNQPIHGATIFLNNTSIATASGSDGSFTINPPGGSHHLLIVTSMGYNNAAFSLPNPDTLLVLTLTRKITELKEVIIEPHTIEPWKKWGKLFSDSFIGNSMFSTKTSIVNPDKIQFAYFKQSNRLEAYADEPIIIENKALGYTISYTLEDFVVNFSSKEQYVAGYVFFEDVEKLNKRHLRNRRMAYRGSVTHFLRSAYSGELKEEGFTIQKVRRVVNDEKARITPLYRAYIQRKNIEQDTSAYLPKDTLQYYESVLRQDEFQDFYLHELTKDSLGFVDRGIHFLYFEDLLGVRYTKSKEELEFLQFHRINRKPANQHSLLLLKEKAPVPYYGNGHYEMPQLLIFTGYWSWRENISNMLPLDYEPDE